MTDDVQARPRTNTRLKAEAPPGMSLHGEEGRKSIGRYEVVKFNRIVGDFLAKVDSGRWPPRDPRAVSASITGMKG